MINGTYSILYIKWDADYFPIGCLTGNSLSEDIETLETSTIENNGWKTYVVTTQGYTVDFSGLVVSTLFDEDANKYSYDVLQILKRNRILIDWKIENSISGNIDLGKGYITDISSEQNVDEFISFNGVITGNGKPYLSYSGDLSIELQNKLETLL